MKTITLFLVLMLFGTCYAESYMELNRPVALDQKTASLMGLEEDESGVDGRIVFFGYTHCADICPMTLGEISKIMSLIERYEIDIKLLFVTIDSARDTEEVLQSYFSGYGNKFEFLRPSSEELEELQSIFAYESVKHNAFEGNEHYIIDHSITSFLLDNDHNIVSLLDLSESLNAETATQRIVRTLEASR